MFMITFRASWRHQIEADELYAEDEVDENMFVDEYEEYLAYISKYKHEWDEYEGFVTNFPIDQGTPSRMIMSSNAMTTLTPASERDTASRTDSDSIDLEEKESGLIGENLFEDEEFMQTTNDTEARVSWNEKLPVLDRAFLDLERKAPLCLFGPYQTSPPAESSDNTSFFSLSETSTPTSQATGDSYLQPRPLLGNQTEEVDRDELIMEKLASDLGKDYSGDSATMQILEWQVENYRAQELFGVDNGIPPPPPSSVDTRLADTDRGRLHSIDVPDLSLPKLEQKPQSEAKFENSIVQPAQEKEANVPRDSTPVATQESSVLAHKIQQKPFSLATDNNVSCSTTSKGAFDQEQQALASEPSLASISKCALAIMEHDNQRIDIERAISPLSPNKDQVTDSLHLMDGSANVDLEEKDALDGVDPSTCGAKNKECDFVAAKCSQEITTSAPDSSDTNQQVTHSREMLQETSNDPASPTKEYSILDSDEIPTLGMEDLTDPTLHAPRFSKSSTEQVLAVTCPLSEGNATTLRKALTKEYCIPGAVKHDEGLQETVTVLLKSHIQDPNLQATQSEECPREPLIEINHSGTVTPVKEEDSITESHRNAMSSNIYCTTLQSSQCSDILAPPRKEDISPQANQRPQPITVIDLETSADANLQTVKSHEHNSVQVSSISTAAEENEGIKKRKGGHERDAIKKELGESPIKK